MNILFWIVIACMTAVVLWPITRLLRKPNIAEGADRQQQNKQIYKSQLAKLNSDHHQNLVSESEYAAALQEIEKHFAEDVMNAASRSDKESKREDNLPYLLLLIVPLLSVSLYFSWGEYRAIDPSNFAKIEKQRQQALVQQRITALEQEIELSPDNTQNYLLLANAYLSESKLESANSVLSKAYQRAPENVDVMLMYAEVLGELNNRSFAGIPADLIRKANVLAPQSRKARWLSSVLAVQEREIDQAISLWQELILTAENPEEKSFLQGLLTKLAKEASSAVDPRSGGAAPQVTVKVALHQKFSNQVDSNDTVFIFARAYSQSGNAPRMPVAILKKQVRDLPGEFVLNDASSMMPTAKISTFEQVVVGARISRAGDAIARSGDLQILSEPIDVQSSPVISLQISDVVP